MSNNEQQTTNDERRTLGLRHLVLNVKNAQHTKIFYMDFFGMDLEWEPDPKQHRDGAYSFYLQDPDGYVVQVIYYPPISEKR